MRKIHILRLGSTVLHGVEGPGAGAGCMDFIYSFLLQNYKMDFYSYIKINQIGEDLDEVILKEGKKIHINIRYPAQKDFEQLTSLERNRIRLNIIHEALLRISVYDNKLNQFVLESIKQKIIDQNFSFYFVYKKILNKINPQETAEIIVNPMENCFDFYSVIRRDNIEICKRLIYNGASVPLYFKSFFSKMQWKKDMLEIYGSENALRIQIFINKCEIRYLNLTKYDKHPIFELFRADISPEEKEIAHQNWIHSLSSAIAAIIRENKN